MGLDMFLKAERYVSNYCENELYGEIMGALNKDATIPVDDHFRGMAVSLNVMYWRKANQVHAWFIDYVAPNSVDNCEPFDVTVDQLEELVDICDTLLTYRGLYMSDEITEDSLLGHCNELLPPQSGFFFFGCTDIDVWYWGDILRTYSKLREIVDWAKAESEADRWWDLSYRASW